MMRIKMRRNLIMAGLLSTLVGLFGRCTSASKEYEIADIYRNLRNQALAIEPSTLGMSASDSTKLLGVLMETGYDKAVATLVTMADGAVSLYFSNGGGFIGVGEHEGPRAACLDFLAFASQFISMAHETRDFPLPKKGDAYFYFLTKDGVYTAFANEKSLQKNQSNLSPLYHKAHEVITQARLADEKLKGKDQKEPNPQSNLYHLLHAATHGDISELQNTLKVGANPNLVDPTGQSALMGAAYVGNQAILKELVNAKCTIDQKDSSGYTALMYACNSGKIECVKFLIENGANVNATDKDNSTPIMFAAQHGFIEIVKVLLLKGGNPNTKGKHGLNARDFAKQNNHKEILAILENSK
jgi:ankyrin repeat protein